MKWEEMMAKARKEHGIRKPRREEESMLQQQCVRWFRLQHRNAMIFSVPNGGLRSPKTAGIMKAEGQLAGVADVIVLAPEGRVLFIEMKTKKGSQEPSQKKFQELVEKMGFLYVICRTFDVFKETCDNFIKDTKV